MRILKFDNYDFLMVSTRDKELITALNITDPINPILFAKFQITGE